MFEQNSKLIQVYLKPQEVHLAVKPTQISTILGSCVAVTFYNTRLKIGGICHALLPSSQKTNDFKYADSSIKWLYERFSSLEISASEMQVKIFGGAEGKFIKIGNNNGLQVGRQNREAAEKTLRTLRLPVSASDVGGERGRKIIFQTDTGTVWLRYLQDSNQSNTLL